MTNSKLSIVNYLRVRRIRYEIRKETTETLFYFLNLGSRYIGDTLA